MKTIDAIEEKAAHEGPAETRSDRQSLPTYQEIERAAPPPAEPDEGNDWDEV